MLTANVINGFAGSVLSSKYDEATATPDFHIELWDLFCNKHPLIAAAAPRGHAKSTAITHAYTLANVLFRERKFVTLVSNTETQATNFLRDIKDELNNNEHLISLFGIEGYVKETETDIIVSFEDGQQFRIMAKGSGQSLRGVKWDGKRPDLIICDDLEDDAIVYNKESREKFKRWFYGALLPCRSSSGIVRMVGTILHLDSLLNNLMPEEHKGSTVIEELKTYSRASVGGWKSVKYKAHNEDFSKILWPDRFSAAHFKRMKEDYERQGLNDVYAQEFLNYPIDESSSYFKIQDFYEIPQKVLENLQDSPEEYQYFVGVDFAISTKERSDYTVFAVIAVDNRGVINVVDIRRGRWDTLEIVDEFFRIQRTYNPEVFFIERGALEKAIGSVLNHEMLSRREYLNLDAKTPTRDKLARARSLQKLVRANAIKFDKGAVWYPDLEDEMIRFPKARHDDQVDALAWVGLGLDQLEIQKTDDELEEEEYNHMLREASSFGRNKYTGY